MKQEQEGGNGKEITPEEHAEYSEKTASCKDSANLRGFESQHDVKFALFFSLNSFFKGVLTFWDPQFAANGT